jgi:DNA topoisomerase-3
MELQMKAICDGQRSKQEVVQQSLDQYRAVYIRTKDQMGVIIAVSANAGSLNEKYTDKCKAIQKYVIAPHRQT